MSALIVGSTVALAVAGVTGFLIGLHRSTHGHDSSEPYQTRTMLAITAGGMATTIAGGLIADLSPVIATTLILFGWLQLLYGVCSGALPHQPDPDPDSDPDSDGYHWQETLPHVFPPAGKYPGAHHHRRNKP